MTRNKRIISLVILSLFLIAGIAIGSYAWFVKSFPLGGATIQTGKLGFTSASYIYDEVNNVLVPVVSVVNDETTTPDHNTEGTPIAGSSISVTGGTAFKEIGVDKPMTFYLVVKKDEGSINFKYEISAFLEGLEPTYEFPSGNLVNMNSGAYSYISAGGFWYSIEELKPQSTSSTGAEGGSAYYATGGDEKAALEAFIKADKVTNVSSGETLFKIGDKNICSNEFTDASDCHFYALTIGLETAAANKQAYSNQSIGIRAHIMASQGDVDKENTTYTVSNDRDLKNYLAQYIPGDTIKLIGDVSINGDVVFGAPVYLDLNGHTLNVTGNVRFDYNLGYTTTINTENGGRLIVRSAGSDGGYAGGDLSIITPAGEVLLEGSNSAGIGQGDIYVQGVFSVMSSYSKGAIIDGCNIYSTNAEGQIPQDANTYKAIHVYDATFLQITNNTTVGEIYVANNDVELFRLHNNGTVQYVHTNEMKESSTQLTTPQIDIHNNGVIVGNSLGNHITLPAWSRPWGNNPNAPADGTDSTEPDFIGNTRIVQGFRSNALGVSGATGFIKDHITVESPKELVEVQLDANGAPDYKNLIVNYFEVTGNGNETVETLKVILDDFFDKNKDKYENAGTVDAIYPLIEHLIIRTGYGKQLSDGEGGDWAYIRNFTGLISIDLTNAETCQKTFADGEVPVLPLEDGGFEYFTGEYRYIPAGALAGLTKLEDIKLPYNAQVILADLLGGTTLDAAFPAITLPDSVLAIELSEENERRHALHQFHIIDMPTHSQIVKVYSGGGNVGGDENAQRIIVPTAMLQDYRTEYGSEAEIFHWIPTSQPIDGDLGYYVHLDDNGKYVLTAIAGSTIREIGSVVLDTLPLNSAQIQIKGIYDYAFYKRSGIEELSISHVEDIGISAFEGASIGMFINHSNVVSVGDKAFKNMQWSQEISFASLENIGAEAFYHDSGNSTEQKTVASISLPNAQSIGDRAFANLIIGGTNGISIGSSTTTTNIGASAFENLNAAGKTVIFNGAVSEIGDNAFKGVYTGALTFESTIGTIGNNAFTKVGSSNLGAITFGGDIAFIKGSITTTQTNADGSTKLDDKGNPVTTTNTKTGGLYNVKGTDLVFKGNIAGTENYAIYDLDFSGGDVLVEGNVTIASQCFRYIKANNLTFEKDINAESTEYCLSNLTVDNILFDGKINAKEANHTLRNISTDTLVFNDEVTAYRYTLITVTATTSIIFNGVSNIGYDSMQSVTTPLFIFNNTVNMSGDWYFRAANIDKLEFNGYLTSIADSFEGAEIDDLYISNVGSLNNSEAFGKNKEVPSKILKIKIDHVGTLGAGLYNLTQFSDWEFESVDTIATGFNKRTNYGSITIKGDISKIEKEAFKGVTIASDLDFNNVGEIGDDAFSAANISGYVHFNGKVDKIGSNAFGAKLMEGETLAYTPTKLKELVFYGEVGEVKGKAFYRLEITGEGTRELRFKGAVQSMGSYAFQNSTAFSIVFEKNLSNIGDYAFANITTNPEIKIMGNISDFGNNIFEGTTASLVLLGVKETTDGEGNVVDYEKVQDSKITTIGEYAFRNCDIGNVYITNVETLGENSFNGSNVSGKIVFLGNVTTIQDSAFENASSIGELRFVGTLGTIGKYVFAGSAESRSNITSLIFEQSIGTIGANTFTNCNIENVSFNGSVGTLGESSFENSTFGGAVTFESTVGTIGLSAFKGAKFGGNFTVKGDVTEIQGEAFRGVTRTADNVTVEIIFEGEVTRISDTSTTAQSEDPAKPTAKSLAFSYMNVDKIHFKKGVSYIGRWAFTRSQAHEIVVGDRDAAIADLLQTTIADKAFTGVKAVADNLGKYSGSIYFYGYVDKADFGAINDGYSNGGAVFKVDGELYFRSVGTFTFNTHNYGNVGPHSIGILRFDAADSVSIDGHSKCPMTIKEIYLPDTVKSFHLTTATTDNGKFLTGLEVFEWEDAGENSNFIATIGGFRGIIFVGRGSENELVIPSQVKVVPKDSFNKITAPVVTFRGVTTVQQWAFASSNIGTINLPKVTVLDTLHSFHRAYSTHTINMPELTEIKSIENFVECRELVNLNVPKLSKITVADAFIGAPKLKALDLPGVTELSTEGIFGNQYKANGTINVYGDTELYTYIENLSMPNLVNISAKAFEGNTTITSLILPKLQTIQKTEVSGTETVTTPIPGVFAGMSNLVTLELPGITQINADGMFANLGKLETLLLPNVTTFGANATNLFTGCSSLTRLDLSSLTAINGSSTFSGLTSITKIIADKNAVLTSGTLNLASLVTLNGSSTFAGLNLESVELNIATIAGGYNFKDCGSLVSVYMPNLVSITGYNNFTSCKSLTDINFPELTTIGGSQNFNGTGLKYLGIDPNNPSFNNMPSLTSVAGSTFESSSLVHINLPSLVNGSAYVFQYNRSLKTVNLPSLISVGHNMFASCTSLESVTMNGLTTVDGNSVFDGDTVLRTVEMKLLTTVDGGGMFNGCSSLMTVDMPLLIKVGGSMFKNCVSLTEFESDTVQKIAHSSFAGCTGLIKLSLPNCTTDSGNSATGGQNFEGCINLVEVYLPNLVNLYAGAFKNCSALRSLSLPSLERITANDNRPSPFEGCNNLVYLDLGNITSFIPSEHNTAGEPITYFGVNGLPKLRVLKLNGVNNYSAKEIFTAFNNINFAIIFGTDTISGTITGDIWNGNDSDESNGMHGVAFGPANNPMISANLTSGKRAPFDTGVYADKIKFYPEGSELYNGTSDIEYMYAEICDEAGVSTGKISLIYCFKAELTTGELLEDIQNIESLTGMPVTSIGASCYLNTVIEGEVLSLGDNVTSIGAHAFSKPLYKLTTEEGVAYSERPTEAYKWSSFKTFETGNVLTIGDYAFRYCIIEDLSFGVKLEKVGKTAFYNGVTNIRIDQQIEGAFITKLDPTDLSDGSVMFVLRGGETANLYVNQAVLGINKGTDDAPVYLNGTLRNNGNYFGAISLSDTSKINTDHMAVGEHVDIYYSIIDGTNNVKITGVIWKDSNIHTLVIPSEFTVGEVTYTVTHIDRYAFSGIKDHITSLTLPKNLAAFDSSSSDSGLIFDMTQLLTNLVEFKVAADCLNYSVENGVLYNKDKSMLILCPAAKTVEGGVLVIPDTVKKFYIHAFLGNSSILDIQYSQSTESTPDEGTGT